jgi:hypothetical protein
MLPPPAPPLSKPLCAVLCVVVGDAQAAVFGCRQEDAPLVTGLGRHQLHGLLTPPHSHHTDTQGGGALYWRLERAYVCIRPSQGDETVGLGAMRPLERESTQTHQGWAVMPRLRTVRCLTPSKKPPATGSEEGRGHSGGARRGCEA